MGQGKGYGKTILFGEHFVVYGFKAIASAIGDCTKAKTEKGSKGKGIELVDNRPAVEGYKVKKQREINDSLDLIFKFLKIDLKKNPVKITLSGNLECASGIGASAALAASVARALNQDFNLGLNEEQINEVAYEGEKASAGNPSGIDNTASVFGGLLVFQKNLEGGKNLIERLSIKKPIEIVLANSKITQDTKEVVSDVKRFKEEDEERFQKILNEYQKVFDEGLKALKNYDLRKLGELMNKNQELLARATITCSTVEEMISIAKKEGAFGAKQTGTGRGGLVICLTPGKELQEKVAEALEKKGFPVMKTVIGV